MYVYILYRERYIFVYIFIYIYVYIYLDIFFFCIYIYSPNKRSFRDPGGVARELDLGGQAQICARELASVACRGLQWPPTTTHHHLQPPTNTYHLPPPTTNDKYDIKVGWFIKLDISKIKRNI